METGTLDDMTMLTEESTTRRWRAPQANLQQAAGANPAEHGKPGQQ
jgi:hypothetical protein